MITQDIYNKYVAVLHEELVPAMGCTEPIAIAYAGAKAKSVLGELPDVVEVYASGNIIKNVKSVIVPNTGGLCGISNAVLAGICIGNADSQLQVLSRVSSSDIERLNEYCSRVHASVHHVRCDNAFDLKVVVRKGDNSAEVHIVNFHTNITEVYKDGECIYKGGQVAEKKDRSWMSVEGIVEFANSVNIDDVSSVLSRQIEYNMAIANEGLANNYGANIGKVLLSMSNDVNTRCKAYAAAGSDARMNGCEMPVVINSGSGNQGITSSVPVIVYAMDRNISKEMLYRALCVSNLVTIHLKTGIGTLSAYCGVVSAGAGAGAGIAYLNGGGFTEIAHTIVNTLAIDSGIICDGAKASCAGKIATAVESGLLGLNMFYCGNEFVGGDGIVTKGVENTIKNISRLAKMGMKQTDEEIISIMQEDQKE